MQKYMKYRKLKNKIRTLFIRIYEDMNLHKYLQFI